MKEITPIIWIRRTAPCHFKKKQEDLLMVAKLIRNKHALRSTVEGGIFFESGNISCKKRF